MKLEPIHGAVVAVGEKSGEAGRSLRDRIGIGDPDDVETFGERIGDKRRFQKSRLA